MPHDTKHSSTDPQPTLADYCLWWPVGEPEPWTGAGGEARWRGEVFELLWVHGKNAPLEGDFEGSLLHLAVGKLWPGCLVLGDERL